MPWPLPPTLLRPGLASREVLALLPSPEAAPELEVPATVPPPVRERLLDALADEGAADPMVRELAFRVVNDRGGGFARCLKPCPNDPRAAFQALLDALPELVVYTPDPEGREVFSRVRATLVPAPGTPLSRLTGAPKGRDDCEGLSTLYAALARAAGLTARPVWIDQERRGARMNHVAAVACGIDAPEGATLGEARFAPAGCAWVEATVPGARVGESPPEAVARHGRPRSDVLPTTPGDPMRHAHDPLHALYSPAGDPELFGPAGPDDEDYSSNPDARSRLVVSSEVPHTEISVDGPGRRTDWWPAPWDSRLPVDTQYTVRARTRSPVRTREITRQVTLRVGANQTVNLSVVDFGGWLPGTLRVTDAPREDVFVVYSGETMVRPIVFERDRTPDGFFQVELPPGTYTLARTRRGTLLRSGGPEILARSLPFEVRSGLQTSPTWPETPIVGPWIMDPRRTGKAPPTDPTRTGKAPEETGIVVMEDNPTLPPWSAPTTGSVRVYLPEPYPHGTTIHVGGRPVTRDGDGWIVRDLPSGSVEIVAASPGVAPWRATVAVVAGGVATTAVPQFWPTPSAPPTATGSGRVVVTGAPAGASVTLSGRDGAVLPLDGSPPSRNGVPSGVYIVTGSDGRQGKVEVLADGVHEVQWADLTGGAPTPEPEAAKGRLLFLGLEPWLGTGAFEGRAQPRSNIVRIAVDGREVFNSDATWRPSEVEVTAGQHTVSLTEASRGRTVDCMTDRREGTVDVAPGATASVNFPAMERGELATCSAEPPLPTEETPPATPTGMSTGAKVALVATGLGLAGAAAYVLTRKPSGEQRQNPRPRRRRRPR